MCCTNIRVNECVCVYVKEKKKEKGIANVSNFESSEARTFLISVDEALVSEELY